MRGVVGRRRKSGESHPDQKVIRSVEDLVKAIQEVHRDHLQRTLVLVGGCSRAGKSWLVDQVRSRLARISIPCAVIKLDNWLVSVGRRAPSSTVMERYDCAVITRDLKLLLQGKSIHPPIYDSVTRRRVCEKSPDALSLRRGILLVDGVVALALNPICKKADLRVFVDVDDSTRRNRLMDFYCEAKGIQAKEARQILRQREKEEVPFIRATRASADMVFLNTQERQ